MAESSLFDTIIQTAGDVGKKALDIVSSNKQAKVAGQQELYTEQLAQQKQDNAEFWHKFAIVSGAIVGGLVLGKILKLY